MSILKSIGLGSDLTQRLTTVQMSAPQSLTENEKRTIKLKSIMAKVMELYTKYKIWVNGALLIGAAFLIYKMATKNRR